MVADHVLHRKISNPTCFISAIILISNELWWTWLMLECMFASTVWLKIMHLCMLVCLAFLLCLSFFNFSIDVCLCSWGCLPGCIGVRRVLFASLRDGEVTEWYQSSRLQQWASMGQEDAVTEGGITFYVQQNSSFDDSGWMEKIQK